MRTHPAFPTLAALVLALAAVAPSAGAAAKDEEHGLSLADMDRSVQPCDDFYQFANGGWLKRAKMPPAYSRYGGFEELSDRNLAAVHRILDDAVLKAKTEPAGDVGLLATFYGTCMDSATAEALGTGPIQPQLLRVGNLSAKSALAVETARLHADGVGALFFLGGQADPGNSDVVITTLNQGGLGLPDRDYYLKPDPPSETIRREYVAHVARTFQLLGDDATTADAGARKVMDLETALARASITRVQQRDPKATYNKMPLTQLRKLCPAFDWDAYLAESRAPSVSWVNVRTPGFFAALDTLIRTTPVVTWRAYLRWHLARMASPYLSAKFVNEDFRFEQVLSGAKEMLPRWRRCMATTDRLLGEPLGQEYVRTYFTPETKARALEMVKNLEAALKDRIQGLAWMSDSTKAQALTKLAAFGEKIGYPDHWRDYSGLTLETGPFVANVERATRFERAYRLGKINGPVDRAEFNMTPPTVNARYSPSLNDILFPAGILQPPFFDPNADDALNYGGIGTVIGHEMTHGYDDSGRQYDARGNLRDWWTPEDARRYKERTDKIVAQYDAYTVADTVHLNGRLTLGENVADLGGLTVAYAALEKALAGKPRPLIDGFTPEQRFFLAYARLWRQLVRPEESRRRVATDPHSPGIWRVKGPLSNMPQFFEAFGCKEGAPMVRPEDKRTAIW